MILAQQFEKAMKKIFGIATLIIALVLGTCFSSQAQIVKVTPVNIDGGFNMYKNQNLGVAIHGKQVKSKSTESKVNDEISILQIPVLIGVNEYIILEYDPNYSTCRYSNCEQTNLKEGGYYAKYIAYSKYNELNVKISN